MKIHVKIQNKTYEVRIDNILTRPIQATVDGEVVEVWPEEVMVPPAGQQNPPTPQVIHPIQTADIGKVEDRSSFKGNLVKAPIPGVIIEIKVNSGDAVAYGQELCVLEAMKMKNIIRAGKAGVIHKILVSTGDQVSQSQTLMEYRGEA